MRRVQTPSTGRVATSNAMTHVQRSHLRAERAMTSVSTSGVVRNALNQILVNREGETTERGEQYLRGGRSVSS